MIGSAALNTVVKNNQDHRQLGDSTNKLVHSILDGTIKQPVALKHPLLNQGFYKAEEQKRRWTKGNAVLPAAPFTEETLLTVKGKALPVYLLSQPEQALEPQYQPNIEPIRLRQSGPQLVG